MILGRVIERVLPKRPESRIEQQRQGDAVTAAAIAVRRNNNNSRNRNRINNILKRRGGGGKLVWLKPTLFSNPMSPSAVVPPVMQTMTPPSMSPASSNGRLLPLRSSSSNNKAANAAATLQRWRANVTPPTALSLALSSFDFKRAIDICRRDPQQAKQWSKRQGFFEGMRDATVLPIHEALSSCGGCDENNKNEENKEQKPKKNTNNNPSEEEIEILIGLLLDAYPESVLQVESSYQRLPLHTACRRHASPKIIQMLLDAARSLNERTDGDDFLGVGSGGSGGREEAPAAKVFVNPGEQGDDDNNDDTYHHECEMYSTDYAVKSCLQPDLLGRLPLHYALSNDACLAAIDVLVSTAPTAVRGVDSRGWTPLHVASASGSSCEVVKRLLEVYPHAIIIRTVKGSSVVRCLSRTCTHRQQLKQILQSAKREYEQQHNARKRITPTTDSAKKPVTATNSSSSTSTSASSTTANSSSSPSSVESARRITRGVLGISMNRKNSASSTSQPDSPTYAYDVTPNPAANEFLSSSSVHNDACLV